MGQTPRSRSQGKKKRYPWKGFITGNIHVKYQSSSTHWSKVISNVKVSERRTEWQTGEKQYAPVFDHRGIKRRLCVFSSPNQCHDVIIACLKYAYWFKLISHVSDVAHGPLDFSKWRTILFSLVLFQKQVLYGLVLSKWQDRAKHVRPYYEETR